MPFANWPPDAIALVENSIAAHGGRDRWLDAGSIRLPFISGSGTLMVLKGFGRTFPAPREFEIRPHEHTTIFHGYPQANQQGVYTAGDVRIEEADGPSAGRVVANSAKHRRTFAGLAKLRRWSPIDALYFFGYALVHYHRLPFTLEHARLLAVIRQGDTAIGVDVEFPGHVETHCRRQQFYFDAAGRIERHDYIAEVVGPGASGAHFWERYDSLNGLLVARRRRVLGRIGRWTVPFPVLCVDMGAGTSGKWRNRP